MQTIGMLFQVSMAEKCQEIGIIIFKNPIKNAQLNRIHPVFSFIGRSVNQSSPYNLEDYTRFYIRKFISEHF